jgi:hypothetical protein
MLYPFLFNCTSIVSPSSKCPVAYPIRCETILILEYCFDLASSGSFIKILFVCIATLARFPLLSAKITKLELAKAPRRCEPKDLHCQR